MNCENCGGETKIISDNGSVIKYKCKFCGSISILETPKMQSNNFSQRSAYTSSDVGTYDDMEDDDYDDEDDDEDDDDDSTAFFDDDDYDDSDDFDDDGDDGDFDFDDDGDDD